MIRTINNVITETKTSSDMCRQNVYLSADALGQRKENKDIERHYKYTMIPL